MLLFRPEVDWLYFSYYIKKNIFYTFSDKYEVNNQHLILISNSFDLNGQNGKKTCNKKGKGMKLRC